MPILDLVVIFKDMIAAKDKAQELRLAGMPFIHERVRGDKLEAVFNERMKAVPRDEQVRVIDVLVLDGYLPGLIKESMDHFDGTWVSIKTNYHRVALEALDTISTKLPPKDILELASHSIKHMGFSWDDFYKIMAEVRKILKMV